MGYVVFESGQVTRRLQIQIIDDFIAEDTETFTVKLMSEENYIQIVYPTASISIFDNDSEFYFIIIVNFHV